VSARVAARDSEEEFRHEAFLYAGEGEFIGGVIPFIHAALAADEPVLVVVDDAKIGLLRSELAADAAAVEFADMSEIGANPARIIPAWRQFLDTRQAGGKRVWGVGEPIWAGRSDAELVEAQRHESLLNLAFADAGPLSLLCPYDTEALAPGVIAGAHRSHPTVVHGDERHSSHAYCGLEAAAAPFSEPMPEPRVPFRELAFGGEELADVRRFVARRAQVAGLAATRGEDLVLAINEVATNSVRHGGGGGTLRTWQEDAALICEIRDRGRLDDPLAGRRRPHGGQIGGYGLWLANQVCDLVQLRSYADGCAVRVHMHTR
jgi:anti-sigma regulatory factor (Ser/Thr protein kinase)